MNMKDGKIASPNVEDERILNSIVNNLPDLVELRGRKIKVGWIGYGAREKMTRIMLEEKDEGKVHCKCVAALVLNGYWKIKLLYWLAWRWMFYVKQYSEMELLPVVKLCKKKAEAQLAVYCTATMLLTDMRTTMMAMTREEASRILQGRSGEPLSAWEKRTAS